MVFSNNLLMGAAGAAAGAGYTIDQSIRFNDNDSAYLEKTFASAGNRQIWTWSAWIKLSGSTARQIIFGAAGGPSYISINENATGSAFFNLYNAGWYWETAAKYRDPSAWYHLVWAFDTTNATADSRMRFYVNGSEVTDYSTKYATGSQNASGDINNNVAHRIGRHPASTNYYDGYLAEINFVDGQQLAPTDFGETNADTGEWVPIAYTGSYGTNGFYITGADSADLGADDSGNGNDFTSSGLTAADQVTDSPTDNQATLNPLFSGVTLSDGNLVATASGNSYQRAFSTFAIDDGGKHVCEFQKSSGTFGLIGIMQNGNHTNKTGNSNMFGINLGNGEVFKANPTASVLTTLTAPANSLMRIEYDSSADTITIFDDGTEIFPAATGVSDTVGLTGHDSLHFGCAPYGSGTVITATFSPLSGTPTTGFEELTTANLPDPTIALPEKYFNTVLYEGNGGGQRVGGFQPITETYTVPNSVIFNDDDSAYLSRTPGSAGNRKTWTFSSWVKRASLFNGSVPQIVFSAANGSTLDFIMQFGQSDDTLRISDYSSGTASNLITTQLFRDTSSWYHFVLQYDTTQATSSDRMKLYVNGAQVTIFGTESYPSLNYDSAVNNNLAHNISRGAYSANGYFDGYLAETYFIDGQALGPDSFGQLDASTNRWIPKDASGLTFGTNGFYLDMETAPGTGSGAGTDSSGNGNNFTESGLAAADQVTDSPTENFATLNPLRKGSDVTLSDGNLVADCGSGSASTRAFSTIGMPNSGKWTFQIEAVSSTLAGTDSISSIGIISDPYTNNTDVTSGSKIGQTTNQENAGLDFYNGFTKKDNADQITAAQLRNAGDKGIVAYDADTKELWLGYAQSTDSSWTWVGGGDPEAGTSPTYTMSENNQYFAISTDRSKTIVRFGSNGDGIAPPTGFDYLNNDNLPLSNGDLSAFVWIKNRDAADNHMLFDAVRGVTKDIHSNSTAAEVTNANTLTRFLKNGFEVSNDAEVNTSAESYVAWQWLNDSLSTSSNADGDITSTVLANTTSGFSIATYTGNATSSQTIGHGLGQTPSLVMFKELDSSSYSWQVYHASLGYTQRLILDGTNAAIAATNIFDAAPTSTVFTIGNSAGINTSSSSHVMYSFAEVEGFSKFSSYTGNGATDGTFVYTGFRPNLIILKQSNAVNDWLIYDSARDPINVAGRTLRTDIANAEFDGRAGTRNVDFVSNGFKFRSSNSTMNASGGTFIYMAFAESPFKTATAR